MKIEILGTSNAIMRDGWVPVAQSAGAADGFVFDNQSVGGTSSLYLAYRFLPGADQGQADRILLDFCINDQMYLDAGTLSVTRILGHYGACLGALARAGALHKVLVLLFPQPHCLGPGLSPDGTTALIDGLCGLLDRLGVEYIDLRILLPVWAAEAGQTVAALFSDPRHYTPAVQARIAQAVLDRLRHPKAARVINQAVAAQFPPSIYRRAQIVSDTALQTAVVGTSLGRRKVHVFSPGARFHLTGAHLLLGAFIWTELNSGTVVINGSARSQRLHLRRAWQHRFLFDTLDMPLPVNDPCLIEVENRLSVPYQRMLGQTSSIYEDAGSQSHFVDFIAAVSDPEAYGALIVQQAQLPQSSPLRRLAARVLAGLRRRP